MRPALPTTADYPLQLRRCTRRPPDCCGGCDCCTAVTTTGSCDLLRAGRARSSADSTDDVMCDTTSVDARDCGGCAWRRRSRPDATEVVLLLSPRLPLRAAVAVYGAPSASPSSKSSAN